LYNGNIAAVLWQSPVRREGQMYQFTYDPLNRMTDAAYAMDPSLSGDFAYNEHVEYDKMGNITGLQRSIPTLYDPNFFYTGASQGLIDDLELSYTGNQLRSVADYGDKSAGFVKLPHKSAAEYAYNKNGAMTKDLNTGISQIQYNVLNLPRQIDFDDMHRTAYVYDASGMKRRVEHVTLANKTLVATTRDRSTASLPEQTYALIVEQTNTDYCGNIIYENGVLKYILTPEGYVTKNGAKPQYNYYLKDHLGNNRVVMQSDGTLAQATDYYPFGMPYPESVNPERQPYKFGGKELDEMHGLNHYDFEARQLSMTLPRFTSLDPLAEKYYSISPYVYCGNIPVNRIDPTGLDWYTDHDGTYQYDPNLTKKNQSEILKEGQAYVGATHKFKDENGKVIENYRKDGSIMYSNESSGYKRVWNNSQKTGNEEMAVMTEKGVLVLPSYDNNSTTATPEQYGYSWENGNIKDAEGNSFNTLGTIHTHPSTEGDKTASMADIRYFSINAPNKPFMVLAYDQSIRTYMSYPGNAYGGVNLPRVNGVASTLPGLVFAKYPLIQTLKQNSKR
jgi:RHS repeat-associated protein